MNINLKKQPTAIEIILLLSIGILSSCNIPSPPLPYKIGDTGPAGGRVFYVEENGLNGLEAAPEDQTNGAGLPWDNGLGDEINASADGVYAGHVNTERIIINQGRGGYAAQLCTRYRGGGFGDWYLPSVSELQLMFDNIGKFSTLGNVGDFEDEAYWSSSEDPPSGWGQDFSINHVPSLYSKSDELRVRAVRAF